MASMFFLHSTNAFSVIYLSKWMILNDLLPKPVAQRVYMGVHVCSVCEVD